MRNGNRRSDGRGPARGGGPGLRGPDVIDADYVHVDAAGREIPQVGGIARARVDAGPASRHQRLSLFSGAVSGRSRPFIGGFCVLIVLAVAGAFWLSGGHVFPTLLTPPAGLVLSAVSAVEPAEGEGSAVMVEGRIVNTGATAHDVPLVAIAGAGPPDDPPLYVRAPRSRLAAGESTEFRARLPAPARGYGDLTVSLAGGGTGR